MRRSTERLALCLILTPLLAGGCVPRCERVCRKVLECGSSSERVAIEECTEACERQDALYEDWEDEDKLDAFDVHRRCLMDASCKQIDDGVCYDAEIFVFAVE